MSQHVTEGAGANSDGRPRLALRIFVVAWLVHASSRVMSVERSPAVATIIWTPRSRDAALRGVPVIVRSMIGGWDAGTSPAANPIRPSLTDEFRCRRGPPPGMDPMCQLVPCVGADATA